MRFMRVSRRCERGRGTGEGPSGPEGRGDPPSTTGGRRRSSEWRRWPWQPCVKKDLANQAMPLSLRCVQEKEVEGDRDCSRIRERGRRTLRVNRRKTQNAQRGALATLVGGTVSPEGTCKLSNANELEMRTGKEVESDREGREVVESNEDY